MDKQAIHGFEKKTSFCIYHFNGLENLRVLKTKRASDWLDKHQANGIKQRIETVLTVVITFPHPFILGLIKGRERERETEWITQEKKL